MLLEIVETQAIWPVGVRQTNISNTEYLDILLLSHQTMIALITALWCVQMFAVQSFVLGGWDGTDQTDAVYTFDHTGVHARPCHKYSCHTQQFPSSLPRRLCAVE